MRGCDDSGFSLYQAKIHCQVCSITRHSRRCVGAAYRWDGGFRDLGIRPSSCRRLHPISRPHSFLLGADVAGASGWMC